MKKYIAALLALIMILSLTACGGKGEDVKGKYLCVGEAYGDNPYSPPFYESWVELNKGGKGIYYSSFEYDMTWEVDGEAFVGTVTFMAMEDKMSGTIKDGVIEVTYGDKRMRFVKEGVEAPADTGEGNAPAGGGESIAPSDGSESSASGVSAESTFDFSGVIAAASMEGAFAGYPVSGFVSPTTSLEIGSIWYGIMEFSDFFGVNSEDYSLDVSAKFAQTSQGNDFFELNTGTEIDKDTIEISIYIKLYDDYFTVNTPLGDCWVFARELVDGEEEALNPVLENGALEIWYDYVHPSGENGCTVHIFLREDGTEWDEENDPLPPSYEDYKAGLGN